MVNNLVKRENELRDQDVNHLKMIRIKSSSNFATTFLIDILYEVPKYYFTIYIYKYYQSYN